MPKRLLHGIPGVLKRIFFVLFAPLREALIDFEELSLSLRIMAIMGYVSVSVLLLLALALDVFKDRLALVSYTYHGIEVTVRQVPFVVLIVGGVCFILGWAYTLTGATDSRRRVFLPIALIFAFQLFMFMPQNNLMFLWFCTAPILVLALVASHFFTRTKRFWRDFPLIEFLVWFGVFLFYVTMFWFSEQSDQELAGDIATSFDFLSLLNIPLWVLLGLGLVDLAVKLARGIVTTLRKLFPGEVLRALAVLFVFLRIPVAFLVIMLDQLDSFVGGMLFLDAILSTLPLLLLLAAAALLRRWSTRSATVIMALGFALPVFILFIYPVLNDQQNIFDPMDAALQGLGIFPPLLLFVALMAHNVLSLGSAFANQDGRIIPRSGRVLLVFGITLLVIGLTIFSVNVRDVNGGLEGSFQEAVNAFFGLSVFLLGLPYLMWVLGWRRDRFVGSEADFEGLRPVFAGLTRLSGRVWLVVSIVTIVLCICLACLVALVLSMTQGGVSP